MPTALFDLTGKTALVTGSSQGLGHTIARGLARAGARVALNGRNREKLDRAVAALQAEGLAACACPFDVRDGAEINAQVQALEGSAGEIGILVNNAGITIRGPLEDFPEDDWQQIMDINLTGVFKVTQAVVPGMIQRRAGKIINICSIQSELARPTIAPYAASKGGLKMLTRSMATEWGKHNIQVNGIAPGYFKTELTQPLYEDREFNAWLCSRTPANRWGEPEELVGAALFLASQGANYVNGHMLCVDGGMLACV